MANTERGNKDDMLSYIIEDLNPRRWLSRFQQTSVLYLLLMFGFYHSLGLLAALVGTHLIQTTIPEYVEQGVPRYLDSVILAGPIEESLFFGIPLYGFANVSAAIVGGLLWTFLHLINTETFTISTLAYSNWLFVFPSYFFSLRTWITGKGWFAIVSHSVWNCLFFLTGCYVGEYGCVLYDNPSTLVADSLLATLFLIATYWLYGRRAFLLKDK